MAEYGLRQPKVEGSSSGTAAVTGKQKMGKNDFEKVKTGTGFKHFIFIKTNKRVNKLKQGILKGEV